MCVCVCVCVCVYLLSLVAQLVKNPPAMQETICNTGDLGSIPGSGRFPGEWNGNPLQYSCLGNPNDRGAWGASSWGHRESDRPEGLNHHCPSLPSPHPTHLGHHTAPGWAPCVTQEFPTSTFNIGVDLLKKHPGKEDNMYFFNSYCSQAIQTSLIIWLFMGKVDSNGMVRVGQARVLFQPQKDNSRKENRSLRMKEDRKEGSCWDVLRSKSVWSHFS